MRKFLVSAMAALTFGGALAAVSTPAQAERYYGRHHYRHHHHRGGGDDVAIAAAAGIAGLALGAALSDGSRTRSSGYYSRSYPYRSDPYRGGYAYDPRYDSYSGGYYGRGERLCITRERVWDPYIGRHVRIERQYRC